MRKTKLFWYFDKIDEHNAYKALAHAVILEALRDYVGVARCVQDKWQVMYQAEKFFFSAPPTDRYGLQFWCDIGDLNIHEVRKHARRIKLKGWRWRAEPGKGFRYLERKKYREQMKRRGRPRKNP